MDSAQKEVIRTAEVDGEYRYHLTRQWSNRPPATWIMLNPSTADDALDDPTIRRCMRFSQGWGYGGIAVVNLFALRSTDPKRLKTHPDPIGPNNDYWLSRAVRDSGFAVAAWGAHGGFLGRSTEVISLLGESSLYALALTKDGEPVHPLYQPSTRRPVPLYELSMEALHG